MLRIYKSEEARGEREHLGGEYDGVAVEEEGEVAAGDVEGPREPAAGGHDEHRPAVRFEAREVRHRGRERRRVGGRPVAHRAEVLHARRVRPRAAPRRRALSARRPPLRRRRRGERRRGDGPQGYDLPYLRAGEIRAN